MSQAEVDVVRQAAQGWSERGIEGLLEAVDPEVEWQSRADLPDSDLYKGHEGLRRLLARFEEDLEGIWFEPEEMIDAGENVVLVFHWGGTGRGSGIPAETRNEAWVMTVSGGKIVKVHEYTTRPEALEAAGVAS